MDREQIILKVLKEHGRSSTTRIAFLGFGHTNSWAIKKTLIKLRDEGKIVQEEETNATYWRLNE